MGESADHSGKRLRRGQTRAAWQVFLKRPMAAWVLCIILFMLPLIPAFLLTESEVVSNVPSYSRFGTELREPDEIRSLLESGTTNTSIVGLDLTWSYQFEEAGQVASQLPNVRWIRLTRLQLRKTSSDVFAGLAKLTSIQLQASNVEPEDVERLARIASLKHVKLIGRSSEADLSVLKALPALTSVHLEAYGTAGSRATVPLAATRHLRELAQIPTLEEVAIESPTALTNTTLNGNTLTANESRAIAEFAEALSPATRLRTIYVGSHVNGAARQALRELRETLPNVTVRPAVYLQEFFGEIVLFLVLSMFAIVVAGLHYVSCSTLPQALLVPGSQAAHRRVVTRLILTVLALQLAYLVMATGGVLAAVAVSAAWAWLACAVVVCLVPRDYSAPRSTLANTRDALACYATVGLLVALVFVGLAYPARIEWFMFGEQPGLALAITAVAAVAIYFVTKPLHAHRRWAENGMAPAADLQAWLRSFGTLSQRMPQGPLAEPHAVGWQQRLEQLAASVRSGDASLIVRSRLWLMAAGPVSLVWTLMFSAVFCFGLLVALVPLHNYLQEGTLAVPSLVEASGTLGMMLPITLFVIVVNLYVRAPLFTNEILLPASRETWRENALLSTLALTLLASCWVWLMAYIMRLAIDGTPDSTWAVCSLLATLAFGVLGAGVAAWITMVRRVLLTACCIGVIMAAVVPFVATLTEGERYSGLVVSTMHLPTFWICMIGIELVIALLVFGTAWRRWTRFELAA